MPLLYAPKVEALKEMVVHALRACDDATIRDKDLGFNIGMIGLNPDPEFLIDLLAFLKPKDPLFTAH